jgi:N-acetylglutamate synthase-like GNAT family acetyltransferase
MSGSIENTMLDALELLHYAKRFRDHRFALVLGPESTFENLVLDLRLLETAGIKVAVFCNDSVQLREQVTRACERGSHLEFVENPCKWKWPRTSPGVIPIVGLEPAPSLLEFLEKHAIFERCSKAGVKKTILVSEEEGLTVSGKLHSHPTMAEVEQLLLENKSSLLNISLSLLRTLYNQQQKTDVEIILLGGSAGNLFEEIFTHRGCGTLFSCDYPNIIRKANISDTNQICLLMKPAVEDQAVLPLSEDQIAKSIGHYSVYTVNGEIVAAARLTDYGEYSEIGKFSMLPRFRGRGRANELARHLIEEARGSGKKGVFALSTNPKMWLFFERLGFEQIAREQLPDRWSAGYDFSRPSKGVIKVFAEVEVCSRTSLTSQV